MAASCALYVAAPRLAGPQPRDSLWRALLGDRLVHQAPHEVTVVSAQRRLHQGDHDHLLLGIGPPVGCERPRPVVVAGRAGNPREALLLADGDAGRAGFWVGRRTEVSVIFSGL